MTPREVVLAAQLRPSKVGLSSLPVEIMPLFCLPFRRWRLALLSKAEIFVSENFREGDIHANVHDLVCDCVPLRAFLV